MALVVFSVKKESAALGAGDAGHKVIGLGHRLR
jgi:hypothetical protein